MAVNRKRKVKPLSESEQLSIARINLAKLEGLLSRLHSALRLPGDDLESRLQSLSAYAARLEAGERVKAEKQEPTRQKATRSSRARG